MQPLVPSSVPINLVLAQSEALQKLQQRIAASKERWRVVQSHLPHALRAHIHPGPLDGEHWTLLVSNPSVAAKLHHMKPDILAALSQNGWHGCNLRIKVQPQKNTI